MIQEAVKPASLEEAAALQKQGMMFLSGGTHINWAPAQIKAEKVILLEGLLPSGIEQKGDTLEIGAGATLQSIADSPAVPEVLRTGAGFIPSRIIRSMATIGGNIAANRTDSYIIPVLFVLQAKVETAGGEIMDVYSYCTEERSDLIVKVLLPWVDGSAAVDRALRSSAAYPSAVTAVRVAEGDCVVALGCAAPHVIRLQDVEQGMVSGSLVSEEDIFKAVYAAINPPAGLKETAEYKRYIASTLIAHSVTQCRKGGK